ncbi:thermonuclease family protein [uncultured Mycolicibacterium sp.]|uniref:thermonuclease family protein n=1 Tax=uncultured Mycolicibacterium sp. TaxID=2320817 RepID=UPI002622C83E|nr:thermonuclease family protein [uncultured Mycolicibacterium sp.]
MRILVTRRRFDRAAPALVTVIGLTTAWLGQAGVTAKAEPVTTTAEVLRVVDGDTIDVRDAVRGRLRIRVLGIDAPETRKPGYTVGCWGPEATAFAESTLLGQRVAVIPDPTQDRTDRYGRTYLH